MSHQILQDIDCEKIKSPTAQESGIFNYSQQFRLGGELGAKVVKRLI